ncbi:MAG: AraC family transcriptional regulator, partial [Rhodospirillales bacterium]|nr:AraC family transcriptional regulator [Rhodospirillales bacterium]
GPDELGFALSEQLHFASADVDEFHDFLCRVLKPHRLRILSRGSASGGRMHRAELGHIALNLIQIGPAVEVYPEQLEDFFLFKLPVRGEGELVLADDTIQSRQGCGVILSPQMPYWSRWSEGSAQLVIQIPRERFEAHAHRLLGYAPGIALRFQPVVDLRQGSGVTLQHAIEFIMRGLRAGGDLLTHASVHEELERMLMSMLLHAQPNSISDLLTGQAAPAPYYILRAERYMAEHLADPLSIGDLVEASGVSSRSLFAGFQRVRGTTPKKRFKSLRLAEIRRALLRGDPASATISKVAARVGYFELGRLAADYKAAYGELPSDTLRAASGIRLA